MQLYLRNQSCNYNIFLGKMYEEVCFIYNVKNAPIFRVWVYCIAYEIA